MFINSRKASKLTKLLEIRNVEINNTQKNMVQTMFWLTQVMGMIHSKGKLEITSNFIAKKKKNTRLIENSFKLSYYKQEQHYARTWHPWLVLYDYNGIHD